MTTTRAVLDAVAAILEATADNRDTAAARPQRFQPARLYGWISAEGQERVETGPGARETFELSFVWTVPAAEVGTDERDAAVTAALDAKREAYAAAIQANRHVVLNGALTGFVVDHDYIKAFEVRGDRYRIPGYYLR